MTPVQKSFQRYQWLAWITGAVLAFLTFVALPYKYLLDGTGEWTAIGWMLHGWLYMVYLAVTADLGIKSRWGVLRLITTAVAGTVPLMSFVFERRLRREYR